MQILVHNSGGFHYKLVLFVAIDLQTTFIQLNFFMKALDVNIYDQNYHHLFGRFANKQINASIILLDIRIIVTRSVPQNLIKLSIMIK